MNTSPAFLAEVSAQIRLAQEELAAAKSHDDESAAFAAKERLLDLKSLENSVLEQPSTGPLPVAELIR